MFINKNEDASSPFVFAYFTSFERSIINKNLEVKIKILLPRFLNSYKGLR